MDELTATLLALAAVWGGMFNVMKIVEMKNGIRDRVLDMHDGKKLSKENKELLIWNDFVPISIGLNIFLFVFTVGFLAIPFLVPGGARWPTWVVCICAASLSLFAMAIDIRASRTECRRMRDYINAGSSDGPASLP